MATVSRLMAELVIAGASGRAKTGLIAMEERAWIFKRQLHG
jgi:hypothetical protein